MVLWLSLLSHFANFSEGLHYQFLGWKFVPRTIQRFHSSCFGPCRKCTVWLCCAWCSTHMSSTRAQPTIHYIVPYMVPMCSLPVTVCFVLEVKCVDYALLSNISLRCAINYCAPLIAVLVVLRQVQNVTDSVGVFCSESIKVPYSYYCLLCSFAYCAVLHYNTVSVLCFCASGIILLCSSH